MPNYKLSVKAISDLKAVATIFVNRRLDHMETGFPLSYDKIQAGILPAKWRDTLLAMEADGLQPAITTTRPECWVAHPAIPRSVKLSFALRTTSVVIPSYKQLDFDTTVLTPDEIEALAKWANNALRERRLAKLAATTINAFLDTEPYSRSTGHILARWPALATLSSYFERMLCSTYSSPTERELRRSWRQKFLDAPANLKPYGWGPADPWPVKNKMAMQLAEMVLTSAEMLPSEIEVNAEVKAGVTSWTPLPGDLDKP